MKNYYIPIIGTISAGKSTLLKGLLGINALQSGVSTTTRFICLIKNKEETTFYHVIPQKEKTIYFKKDGEETKGEENIKERIKKINQDLSNRKGTKDDIFYMLETPIKNIENIPLLEFCYFMDIPGLNENMSSYIEIVFSLITINDILFEIIVFDSTSIGSDNIVNIFKDLDKKKCLKKNNNLFILNKIDQCTKGGQGDIINSFKQYFYETFEDEKNENKDTIFININENLFIPMNSILYLAETNIDKDFTSLLILEFFSYLEYPNKSEASTFYDFLKKRIESIIENGNLEIDGELKKIGDKEMVIITNSVEDIKKLAKNKNSSSDFQLGINLSKKAVSKEMKRLFLIQKKGHYHCIHSIFYIKLQEFLKNINLNKNDLSSPPSVSISSDENNIHKLKIQDNSVDNPIIKNDNHIVNEKSQNIDVSTIEQLENFLKETFKIIDPKNELENFKISLQSLRENILGRKIRIAFIGNISVGKSTVLNCIIGEELLPTKDSECTYRGVILRYKDINKFRLYKTKLFKKGIGLDEYYFFETAQNFYCEDIEPIKSYLNNKNNDKNISDDDAYIVIAGRLKIFDFIKMDEELINKIEFIDLPGPDRKKNTFNEKEYYKKILKFSNCCIYINEPKSIDDTNSVKRMTIQYLGDKEKVFPTLRQKFIKSCLFLVNKSDILEDNNDKNDIINNLYKNMKNVEKDLKMEDMNITFFSGKKFIYYLYIIKQYVKDPYSVVKNIFNDYYFTILTLKGFKSYFISKLEKVEEDFELNLEEEIEVNEEFHKNLIKSFDNLYKDTYIKPLSRDDENEIIKKLYNIGQQLLSKNLSQTEYSHTFFDELKKVILYSESLQKENLNNCIIEFFSYTDMLFQKDLNKQNEQEKLERKEKFKFLNEIVIPTTKDIFNQKEKNLKNIIELGRLRAEKEIEKEIEQIDEKLKEVNNDLDKASQNLQIKINNIIEGIRMDQKKELENLREEIEKLLEKKLNNLEIKKSISSSQIDTNKGISIKMIISLFTSTISGLAVRSGLVTIANSMTAAAAGAAAGAAGAAAGAAGAAGAAAGGAASSGMTLGSIAGPWGIAIGFGVGISICLGSFLYYYLSKSNRYKTGLEAFKIEIIKCFNESEKNCLNDFNIYKDSFFKEVGIKTELLRKNIDSVDEKKWEDIKKNYQIQKKIILEKINCLNLKTN